jgi:hypothetical protein
MTQYLIDDLNQAADLEPDLKRATLFALAARELARLREIRHRQEAELSRVNAAIRSLRRRHNDPGRTARRAARRREQNERLNGQKSA